MHLQESLSSFSVDWMNKIYNVIVRFPFKLFTHVLSYHPVFHSWTCCHLKVVRTLRLANSDSSFSFSLWICRRFHRHCLPLLTITLSRLIKRMARAWNYHSCLSLSLSEVWKALTRQFLDNRLLWIIFSVLIFNFRHQEFLSFPKKDNHTSFLKWYTSNLLFRDRMSFSLHNIWKNFLTSSVILTPTQKLRRQTKKRDERTESSWDSSSGIALSSLHSFFPWQEGQEKEREEDIKR